MLQLMRTTIHSLLTLTLVLILTGCSSVNSQLPAVGTFSPEMATGTAEVAEKSTQAAEATLYPPTPIPSEPQLTEDWTGWTPSPGEIVAADNGKVYDFWLTSRFSIVLEESAYPAAKLVLTCAPDVILGRISNIEPAPPAYYVNRYEGVALGQCTIRDGQFEVTINIVNHP